MASIDTNNLAKKQKDKEGDNNSKISEKAENKGKKSEIKAKINTNNKKEDN